jgi:hypothetical protein
MAQYYGFISQATLVGAKAVEIAATVAVGTAITATTATRRGSNAAGASALDLGGQIELGEGTQHHFPEVISTSRVAICSVGRCFPRPRQPLNAFSVTAALGRFPSPNPATPFIASPPPAMPGMQSSLIHPRRSTIRQ